MAERDRLQSWEPVAAAGTADENRKLVSNQFAAAIGENRRSIGQARTILLATASGESSDKEAVWQHGAANLGAAAACGMTETARQEEKVIQKESK